MDRPPTSRDVAARAGVSQSTVSYVFSGKGNISEKTKARVLQAADELQYTVNLAARSMRTQRSGRIAIVMSVTNWHLAPILDGAASAAHEAGYVVEVQSLPQNDTERDQRLQEIIDSGQFEGVLSMAPMDRARAPRRTDRTVVVALTDFDENMHVSGELADATPVVEMMEELARRGHRRFLHLAGRESYPSAQARRAAYEKSIELLGLTSLGVLGGDWTAQTAERVVSELPDDTPPVAIIAGNDLVATGAVRGALLRGWTVPGDVSVTGWDDDPTSAFQVPSLTTVHVQRDEIGRRGIERLLAVMKGEPEPADIGGTQTVVWRESTGAPEPSA